VAQRQILKRVTPDLGAFERLHAMVGTVEEQVLQVEEIAGHMDRHDLPCALCGQLLPERQTRNDEAAMLPGRLALAQHIGPPLGGSSRISQSPKPG